MGWPEGRWEHIAGRGYLGAPFDEGLAEAKHEGNRRNRVFLAETGSSETLRLLSRSTSDKYRISGSTDEGSRVTEVAGRLNVIYRTESIDFPKHTKESILIKIQAWSASKQEMQNVGSP